MTTIRRLNHDGSITSYTVEEYIKIIKGFHGFVAPGLLIGGFMVDYALKNLPAGDFFDAISETNNCLPDAIQLLTPCTIGNGWLKIMNFSRYALSLYEKKDGSGVRIFVDSKKVEDWDEIKNWFFKLKTKKEQDYELLIKQIKDAGAGLCSMKKIKVKSGLLDRKHHGSKVTNCTSCGEAFKPKDGLICPACLGENPYAD